MIRLTRTQLLPIGVDIGHDSVKLLQLEACGQSLSVRAAARSAIPAEARADADLRVAAAVELIRQMLRSRGFRGRRAVAALPRELLAVKNLRLPKMPPEELEAAAALEARQAMGPEAEEAELRFIPAGEVRQGADTVEELIVLAARNDQVNGFVQRMLRAGLALESLDIEPAALYRGVDRFIRRRHDELEVHVLLDVGFAASTVVIGKGRQISFLKSIDIGCGHFHEAISRKLQISQDEAAALRRRNIEEPAGAAGGRRDPVRQAVFDATRPVMEQLGRELSLCLRYWSVTFRGHRPTRLRLLGGESADPDLGAVLRAAATLPVEPGRPLASVDVSRMSIPDRKGTLGEWAVAMGLSLRLASGPFAAREGTPRGIQASLPAGAEEGAAVAEEASHA